MRGLVVVLAVLLVNLPAVHDSWTERRITREGVDVEATVLRARTIDGRHLVDYRLPEDTDPARREFSARLDDAAYEHAREGGRMTVRVVPGRPGANRPEGEVRSPVLLWAALGADLIFVTIAGLWLRRRRASTED